MDLKFNYEYDGIEYQVEVEYKVMDGSYDDEFGTVKAAYADPVAFTTYVNGGQVILRDRELIALLWKECDLKASEAIQSHYDNVEYAL
jgi:hypothetical protein